MACHPRNGQHLLNYAKRSKGCATPYVGYQLCRVAGVRDDQIPPKCELVKVMRASPAPLVAAGLACGCCIETCQFGHLADAVRMTILS